MNTGWIDNHQKNKTMKAKITFLFITLVTFQMLLTMCSTNKTENSETKNDFIEINIDELDLKDSVRFSTFFSGVKIIPLETNKNCLIGRITEIEIINDTLYVLDQMNSKSLFVFDLEGNFVRKIGNEGRGPGEYVRPRSFTIDTKHNQIHIMDSGRKILTYTLDGKFISEITPELLTPFLSIKNLNGVNYVEHMIINEESDFLISAIDNSGTILNQWLPANIYLNGFELNMSSTNQLVKTNNDIKYMRLFMDTIFSIQPDNQIKPFIHISTQNKITKAEMNQLNQLDIVNNQEEMNKYHLNKRFRGITGYMESPNLIMFNFNNNISTHTMFYSPNTKKYICTNHRIIDDLAQINTFRNFYSSYKNYFVSAIDQTFGRMDTLINNLKNGKIKSTNKNQIDFEKLNENSNPIVILYECKDGF